MSAFFGVKMSDPIELFPDEMVSFLKGILDRYKAGGIQDLVIGAATHPDDEGHQLIYQTWTGHTLMCDGLLKALSRDIDAFENIDYEDQDPTI